MHTRLHRDTHDSFWQTDGWTSTVLRGTHTCWLSMSKHTECSHRHLQHTVYAPPHTSHKRTRVYAHTLIVVRTPFLVHKVISGDMPTRTHTQIRSDEKWQDMSERPMTASLISSHSIFSPGLFLCHRFISRISTHVLEFICRWNMIPAFILVLNQTLWSRGMIFWLLCKM